MFGSKASIFHQRTIIIFLGSLTCIYSLITLLRTKRTKPGKHKMKEKIYSKKMGTNQYFLNQMILHNITNEWYKKKIKK